MCVLELVPKWSNPAVFLFGLRMLKGSGDFCNVLALAINRPVNCV
jgi:hypothetical protein